jgi:hypothetical protein
LFESWFVVGVVLFGSVVYTLFVFLVPFTQVRFFVVVVVLVHFVIKYILLPLTHTRSFILIFHHTHKATQATHTMLSITLSDNPAKLQRFLAKRRAHKQLEQRTGIRVPLKPDIARLYCQKPNYYDRTRKNRTPESETVMVCFRSRTFFEKPAHIREGSYDDMVRWENQQDKKFIHFESVQLPAIQALFRGVLQRAKYTREHHV